MVDLTKPVSCRQFAKMVGRAESAARKARERGSISKGYHEPTKQFIPNIAAEEWGVEILPEYRGEEYPVPVKKTPLTKPRSPKIKSDPVTAEDFVNEMMHESVPKVSKKEIEDFGDDEEEISEGTSKTEAERRIAIYKAKMAELAYKERKKMLISVDKLKIIHEYGTQIRTDIEGIPDRIIDDILAHAEDRKAAKRILTEEIYITLNRLSEFKINL